jgi:hypothetical protein
MAVGADRHQSGRKQELPNLEGWSESSHAGDVGVDDLFPACRPVRQRDQVDLDGIAQALSGTDAIDRRFDGQARQIEK